MSNGATLAALSLGTEDKTKPDVQDPATLEPPPTSILARFNHNPVVDSLLPAANSSASVMPPDHKQINTTVVVFVLAVVGLCAMAAATFFLVRFLMRRAAIKRRRQASWILKSGQWNTEPKRTEGHETRTGCSDTSSSFTAYPYPLSEHF